MRIYITGSMPGQEKAKEDKADDSRLTDEQRRERSKRLEAQEHFRRCCANLGSYLAKQGHSFVFGSVAEHTADRAVLEGVKRYAATPPGARVNVTFVQRDYDSAKSPDGQTSINAILPPASFDVEMRQVQAGNNHARLIAGFPYADVGLLICGGGGTTTAGVAALALKHPTLPLPHFGGASAQAWHLISPRLSR